MDSPQHDLVSKLVVEQVKLGHIERSDAVQIAFLLLVAGNATMVNMIALGVVTLFQNPDQLAELKADTSLAPKFVEELCRYHTGSALAIKRTAKEPFEIGGKVSPYRPSSKFKIHIIAWLTFSAQLIQAGEGIIASNQSANRDEDVFVNPNRFDMHRDWPVDGLGFGFGDHRCIAEALAKTELSAVFSTLFQKLPGLKLAIPINEISYTPLHKDVGIQTLPATW
jgi:fungal nitric oxide reductase